MKHFTTRNTVTMLDSSFLKNVPTLKGNKGDVENFKTYVSTFEKLITSEPIRPFKSRKRNNNGCKYKHTHTKGYAIREFKNRKQELQYEDS